MIHGILLVFYLWLWNQQSPMTEPRHNIFICYRVVYWFSGIIRALTKQEHSVQNGFKEVDGAINYVS